MTTLAATAGLAVGLGFGLGLAALAGPVQAAPAMSVPAMSVPGAPAAMPDTSAPALLLADYACGPGYRIGPYGRCYPYRRPSYFAPPRRYDYDRPRYYYDRPRYYRDDDDD